MLNSKYEISTDIYYKDTSIHDNLPYDSARPESCKKNIPFNLAQIILVFVTGVEKVKLRLSESRIWLNNNNKYPDHITLNAFHSTKLQGPAPKPKNNFSNITFVTSFTEIQIIRLY